MAAFKAMCEGYLGISAHWHLFQYFFRFTCLRDGSRAATTLSCAPVVHRVLHHEVAEELGGRPRQGAGKDPQAPLGRAGAPPRSRSHPGGGNRAVPRSRSRAALEATTSPLRDDGRQGPLGGNCDRAVAPVVSRGPASRGAGEREVDLLVVAVAAAPNAPQRGDRKICE
jgi:hypothetical protein